MFDWRIEEATELVMVTLELIKATKGQTSM